MAEPITCWTSSTGTKVCVGDIWQDTKPLHGPRGPYRTLRVAGFMPSWYSDGGARLQAFTEDYRWQRRLIKGHLVNFRASSFVKRFTLVTLAPDPAPADPNALKPCPFCGSSDLGMHDYGDDRTVSCSQCDCEGPRTDGEHETTESEESEAQRLWNTRAEPVRG